jgi:microcystin-dependent protein
VASRVQTIRYYTTLERPPVTEYSGELYINYADIQIGALDTSKSPVDFVAVRYFSQLALYVEGDYVVYNGYLYKCIQDTVVGPFDGTRWSEILDVQEVQVLIAIETQRAEAAEQALQNNLNTETANRQAADTTLQNEINGLNTAISNLLPPGISADYYGSVAPTGWLIEDGTVYNISQYPALGALLGNRFGGNGTTTFATPPSVGRFGVAVGAGFPLGSMGGAGSATLNATNMPVHTHTIQPHGHTGTIGNHAHPTYDNNSGTLAGVAPTLGVPVGVGTANQGPSYVLLNSVNTGPSSGAINVNLSALLTTDPAGGSGGATTPINTLPPYISRTRIIKT